VPLNPIVTFPWQENNQTTKTNTMKSTLARFRVLAILLIVIVSPCFSQNQISIDKPGVEKEWWYPIIKKHNLKADEYSAADRLFMMGSKIYSDEGMITVENASVIIRKKSKKYQILSSKLVNYDPNKGVLSCKKGILKTYLLASKDTLAVAEMPGLNISIHLTDD